MQKIIMLGTGCGFVYECYETCFVLQNDDKYFLIDTGGSSDIVKNLKLSNIGLEEIHDIFISHTHTDHILGLFWIFKRLANMVKNGKYVGKLNIYCNDEVAESINIIYPRLFALNTVKTIKELINIIVLNNGDVKNIAGRDYKFIDLKGQKNKLFGFETILDNKEKLIFCGDETLNPMFYKMLENADYVMHESFCLDAEQDIYKPYEKKHSTVKSVCENLKDLNIKNLILYHTVDDNLSLRKERYIKEAKEHFSGNVLVPDDLEVIELNK